MLLSPREAIVNAAGINLGHGLVPYLQTDIPSQDGTAAIFLGGESGQLRIVRLQAFRVGVSLVVEDLTASAGTGDTRTAGVTTTRVTAGSKSC